MKQDIDALMQKRNLAAILVVGGEGANIAREYMTNGAHISWGAVAKKLGEPPVLYAHSMEIEEARKSGLNCVTFDELGYSQLRSEISNRTQLELTMWGRYLQHADITGGRIGLYGTVEANELLALSSLMSEFLPDYEFVGETGLTLFQEAFVTKDAEEIARIRSVAERTNEVIQLTWDFIASHRAEGATVVNDAGEPLTIGAVKAFIIRELMVRGLEDTGMIFAQGRDAGFPHNHGENSAPLQTGQSIVFDLFPREQGGGYHHDMTRTWCIGHAEEQVQTVYDHVMTAFDKSIEAFGVGKPARLMQEVVLDHFEGLGYSTSRSEPGTQKGYVHSLGHGVGLLIHESPSLTHLPSGDNLLQVGNCITVEPGLYDPEAGYGVRIEDTFIVNENGELESLTPFKKDLVIPLSE
jgi:Xaa-Pro aminopeptidase